VADVDLLLKNVPPHDVESERAVLACALVGGVQAFDEASAVLSGDEFYKPAHALLWAALRAVRDRGEPVDVMTARAQLMRAGHVEQVDGEGREAWLAALCETIATTANVAYYARSMQDLARKRALIKVGAELTQTAFAIGVSAEDCLAQAERALTTAAGRAPAKRTHASEGIARVLERYRRTKAGEIAKGYMCGLPALDEIVAGWKPGEYSAIAARTSVGKTTLALNLASRWCEQSLRVGWISLEMPEEDVIANLAIARAGLDGARLRAGELTPDEEARLESIRHDVGLLPFVIDDSPGCDASKLVSRVRAMATRGFAGRSSTNWTGCHVVVVDYLQHVTVDDERQRAGEVGRVSQALKILARETGTHVLAILQLNRGLEARRGREREPRLSDVRDSGQIEQDLDLALLLSRPSYDDPDHEDPRLAVVRVAKNRNGGVGTAHLDFERACMRYVDRTDPPPEPRKRRGRGKNKFAEAGEDA
jgi:replicative DNA helicase